MLIYLLSANFIGLFIWHKINRTILNFFKVGEKPQSVTILRGTDPLNRTLTVTWQPPAGPKTFVADCEHEYIVTLKNTKDPNDIQTGIVAGKSNLNEPLRFVSILS